MDLRDLVTELTPEQLTELVESLPPEEAEAALTLLHADDPGDLSSGPPALLPHQQPPAEGWDGWTLAGGRGSGKTMAGSRWIGDLAADTPGLRGRIIAPTLGDAVNSVVLDPQSGVLAAHPEARLIRSGVEGTRVVWANGSTLWCVGTPTPSAVDRLRALTNIDCLTGDALVTTDRGPVRMDRVTTRDRVLTRDGWCRVLWSGAKGTRADLYEVEVADGRTLRGTGDHPVWTETRGWVTMRFLKNTDILRTCEHGNSSAASPSTSASGATSMTPEDEPFTGQSGSRSTVRCRRAGTSTISTTTRATTGSTTSTRSPLPSTTGYTVRPAGVGPARRVSDRPSVSGGHGRVPLAPFASSAVTSSPTGTTHQIGFGSALTAATSGTGTLSGSGPSSPMPSVSSVVPTSGPSGTRPPEPYPSPATVRVLRSTPISGAAEQVYDLTVEGAHEFYANGILVHNCDYFEEAAANPQLQNAVEQAQLSRRGHRLPKPLWIATTTPRPLPLIRQWYAGGTEDERVVVTRATTMDNPHTPAAYRSYAASLQGTRLYRQEVLGEILDDVEGALWTQHDLDRSTIAPAARAEVLSALTSIVVGVDPPSGSGTCGVVVVGATPDGTVYVLDDYSVTDPTPNEWAGAVAAAHADYTSRGLEPLVVAEVNQGGRMVTEVLRTAHPSLPIRTVHAAQGKQARAEPVALLWEADEQRARLAPATPDGLSLLRDQCLAWVPGTFSPDRLDAMVWAVSHLRRRAGQGTSSVGVPHARTSRLVQRPTSSGAATGPTPSPRSRRGARVIPGR